MVGIANGLPAWAEGLPILPGPSVPLAFTAEMEMQPWVCSVVPESLAG